MKSKGSEEQAPHVTRGNVLDDLGFSASEALEIRVKAEVYRDLLAHIRGEGLSQEDLGRKLGLHQPDVSNLLNGRVSRFSLGKLIQMAGRLDLGAQVKLTKPKNPARQRAETLDKAVKRRPAAA